MDVVAQNYLTVVNVELVEPEIPANGIAGCDTHTRIYQAKNSFFIVLYELGSETGWRFDGYLIDGAPEWDTYGNTSGLWWEYAGNVNEPEHGGDGDEYHKDYVQAHFRLCCPLSGAWHTSTLGPASGSTGLDRQTTTWVAWRFQYLSLCKFSFPSSFRQCH